MYKPCPFCETEPEYHERIAFAYPMSCIARAWIECPVCLGTNGKSEVRRTIDWRNQEIVDQIHTMWPNMKLAYKHCEHGPGMLTNGCGRMDPVAQRAIQPILKRAVIALWDKRTPTLCDCPDGDMDWRRTL